MKTGYQARVSSQTLSWALGNSYHNETDNECCPDFSCCQPACFTVNADERWAYYKKHKTSSA